MVERQTCFYGRIRSKQGGSGSGINQHPEWTTPVDLCVNKNEAILQHDCVALLGRLTVRC